MVLEFAVSQIFPDLKPLSFLIMAFFKGKWDIILPPSNSMEWSSNFKITRPPRDFKLCFAFEMDLMEDSGTCRIGSLFPYLNSISSSSKTV
uniref:Uncharacterized protein n=1 Tax=Nelumbo nucifera TaxID=4432 RepID=A0A822Y6D8_NELNU|nr:TPA_asm: hypothetical protein HUJ06_028204 [Nelumbo nucifera]